MQPSLCRIGVAQLMQTSEREDERLLDRVGGVFPAAKDLKRTEVESRTVTVEQCAQGQAIAATSGMHQLSV